MISSILERKKKEKKKKKIFLNLLLLSSLSLFGFLFFLLRSLILHGVGNIYYGLYDQYQTTRKIKGNNSC
jgi:hypothetical protein